MIQRPLNWSPMPSAPRPRGPKPCRVEPDRILDAAAVLFGLKQAVGAEQGDGLDAAALRNADADLHRSRIHSLFDVSNRAGLVSILAEGVVFHEAQPTLISAAAKVRRRGRQPHQHHLCGCPAGSDL